MRPMMGMRVAVLFMIAVSAQGGNLTWTGSADGKWGSGLNWTNSAGTTLSFASGDNVRFDDSASVRSINLSATLSAVFRLWQ